MDSLVIAVLSRDPTAVALALREMLGFDLNDYDASAEWMRDKLAESVDAVRRGVAAFMSLPGAWQDRDVMCQLAGVCARLFVLSDENVVVDILASHCAPVDRLLTFYDLVGFSPTMESVWAVFDTHRVRVELLAYMAGSEGCLELQLEFDDPLYAFGADFRAEGADFRAAGPVYEVRAVYSSRLEPV